MNPQATFENTDTSDVNPPLTTRRVPGVDIVFSTSDEVVEALFDQRTLKLIGSLHRRFWERRRAMLQSRALRGGDDSSIDLTDHSYGEVTADLRQYTSDWTGRLDQFLALRTAIGRYGANSPTPTIRIRGWSETEAGVLVDGRAVPGCVFDVAVAMSQGADLLREGQQAFIIDMPETLDDSEAKLWTDLVRLAEDRTGVERGTTTVVTASDHDDLGGLGDLAVA